MKKLILCLLALMSVTAKAQPGDDMVYFEDSKVKHRRFAMALVANPNWSNRNLVDDELSQGQGFDLSNADSKGDFAFNYNIDLFYSLSSNLDIGVGFGRAQAFWSVTDVGLYSTENFPIEIMDTIYGNGSLAANMWSVPVKLNFNTTISDLFDLEVIPTVSLIFVDKYDITLSSDNLEPTTFDMSAFTRSTNYRIGISLGGTWYASDNVGFFVRANANYILNSLIQRPGFPRQTLYSVGADIGIKFRI